MDAAPTTSSIEVESTQVLLALSGPQSNLLTEVARQSGADVSLRGNTILVAGDADDVKLAERFLRDAAELVGKGFEIGPNDVASSMRGLRADPDRSLTELLDETIIVTSRKRPILPKSRAQRQYVEAIRTHDLIFGIGPAGTGKTYLAMAKAVQALQAKKVNRIILTRPAVEAGERLGYLPGTLYEKIDPYLRPLYDALHDMVDPESIPRLTQAGTIEVAPLAYMRGRTLNDAFIVLDEAQNTTPEQMKMFLTRLGFGSQVVVTGDITQVDLPGSAMSGLVVVREILDGVEDVHFAELTSGDVVRHRLVGEIVDAYARWDATKQQPAAIRADRRPHQRSRR